MNEIRIIIYVVLLVISIVSLVKNNLKKKENRKISKETRESLNPIRVITQEELNLINSKYKFKGNVYEDANVYRIHGDYSLTEISHRGGSVQTHYIGPHEIYLPPTLANIIKDVSEADVVFTDKNIAIIIEVPERFSIKKESQIFQELNNQSSSSLNGDKNFEKLSREMSDNELNFLNKDIRVFPALLMFSAFLIPVFNVDLPALIISGFLLLLSLILYLKPMSDKIRRNNRLVRISGDVNYNQTLKQHTMDRFILKMPKHWNIEDLTSTTIEGYAVDDNAVNIDVLKIDNKHSIDREFHYSPQVKKGKLTLLSILLGINLFILLIPDGGIDAANFLYNKYKTRDLKSDFYSYNEINNYDFLETQDVNFHDIKVAPTTNIYDEELYIVPKDISIDINFDKIVDRINAIKEIQRTYYFMQIVALGIDDYIESVSFLNDYEYLMIDSEPGDFYDWFRDNDNYLYLIDVYDNLIDEDYEIDLDQLEYKYSNFYYTEANIINEMIKSEINNALGFKDKIKIRGYNDYIGVGVIYDTSLMTFSVDYYGTPKYSPVPNAISMLDNIKELYSNNNRIDISGFIGSSKNNEDGIKEIYVNSNFYSRDLTIIVIKVIITFLALIIFIIVLLTMYRKFKSNNNNF